MRANKSHLLFNFKHRRGKGWGHANTGSMLRGKGTKPNHGHRWRLVLPTPDHSHTVRPAVTTHPARAAGRLPTFSWSKAKLCMKPSDCLAPLTHLNSWLLFKIQGIPVCITVKTWSMACATLVQNRIICPKDESCNRTLKSQDDTRYTHVYMYILDVHSIYAHNIQCKWNRKRVTVILKLFKT